MQHVTFVLVLERIMTIIELYSNLTTIHVNGYYIYIIILFDNYLETLPSRPEPYSSVHDWLEKLWLNQWYFSLQLMNQSYDCNQVVPLATPLFSSQSCIIFKSIFHARIRLRAAAHCKRFLWGLLQPGTKTYIHYIHIYVILKIIYIQFSPHINCVPLLMIITVFKLI